VAIRTSLAVLLLMIGGTALAQTAATETAGDTRRELPPFPSAASSQHTDLRLPGAVVILVPSQGGPAVSYATTSIKCGDTIYQVSTGTSGGACGVTGPAGKPSTGADCSDGGSRASATCNLGCGPSAGSGACTISTGK
jgi:hypothetical protein